MTREQLESKSLEDLREIAKLQGTKSITKYRKAELVEIIMNGGGNDGVSGIVKKNVAQAQAPILAQEDAAAETLHKYRNPRHHASKQRLPETTEEFNKATEISDENSDAAPQPEPDMKRISQKDRHRHKHVAKDEADVLNEMPNEQRQQRSQQQYRQPRQQDYQNGYNNNRRQNPNQPPNQFNNQQRQNYNQQRDNNYYQPQQNNFRRQEVFSQQYSQQPYQQQPYMHGNQMQYQQPQYPQPPQMQYRTPQQEYYRPAHHENYPPHYEVEEQQYRQPKGDGFYKEYNVHPAVAEMLETGACADCEGVLEINSDGSGVLRTDIFNQNGKDIFVSNAQIRRFSLRTGDLVAGKTRIAKETDKYLSLLYILQINGDEPDSAFNRKSFDELVPIYPNERITLSSTGLGKGQDIAIRLIDLIAPIGKGQRGLIVSQPKSGKTTLLKNIAHGITANYPDIHLMVVLIDERPEEVTDMKRSIEGEFFYSTFDELPEHHTRVAELAHERAMRLVERGKDVVILMDSITRLARAYNITVPASGKTLSGGMDPAALHKPKRFFGSARNIEDGGSLTIIATALTETGSRMDDIVFEEFKGTGNMEIHLDRKMSEKRIFPAIDLFKSGTRREELLLTKEELEAVYNLRRSLSSGNTVDVTEQIIAMFEKTADNNEFVRRQGTQNKAFEKDGFVLGKRLN